MIQSNDSADSFTVTVFLREGSNFELVNTTSKAAAVALAGRLATFLDRPLRDATTPGPQLHSAIFYR
jgi:hypothetical protein